MLWKPEPWRNGAFDWEGTLPGGYQGDQVPALPWAWRDWVVGDRIAAFERTKGCLRVELGLC